MDNRKNTIFYNPHVVATKENFDAAREQFLQVMKDAPKPGDYPGKKVVVSPKFQFTGQTINLADLLAEDNENNTSCSEEKIGVSLKKSV